MANLGEHELIEAGLVSLAEIFGFDPKHLVAARAINWAHDPLAGGAYSYATPETRAAQAVRGVAFSSRRGGSENNELAATVIAA
jgi:monoamine oxidase